MKTKLVIQINKGIERWAFLDEEGKVKSGISQMSLLEFLPKTKNNEIFILVPAKDVLLTEIKLPRLSRRKLMKALPFALEDKIVDQIENIHFSAGIIQKNLGLPTAVVSKAKMDLWMQNLAPILMNKSPFLIVMTSQALALPLTLQGWTVSIEETNCIVRLGLFSGFAIDLQYLWPLLRLFLKNKSSPRPDKITVIGQLTISKEEYAFWQRERITLDQQDPLDQFILMTQSVHARSTLNLLQGHYTIKFIPPVTRKLVLKGLGLLGIWLALLTMGNCIKLGILASRQAQLGHQIQAHYEMILPNTPFVLSDTQALMKTQLNKLQDQSNGNEFLGLISDLSATVSELPGIKLMGFDFQNSLMKLDLEANSFTDVDQFIHDIKFKNFKIEQQSEIKTDKLIKVQLTIHEPQS